MTADFQIAADYANGSLVGWLGTHHPELLRSEFELLQAGFVPFAIRQQSRSYAGKKHFLHKVVRAVLGKDTPNYPQQIGDCVSFGAKNGGEYLTCTEIAGQAAAQEEMSPRDFVAARRLKWRPIFPPYYYGTGRVYVGGGQMGYSDGSTGSWMAEAVQKYGTLFADEPEVPAYSGRIAKQWGSSRAPLDRWKPTASKYLVRSAALVKTWEDLVAALANGYPCPTASNVGYDMEPAHDGFHRQRGSWSHQMCFIGADDNDRDPYALILNNWGDVHGHLKDFDSDEMLPVGTLRVRKADALKHLRAGETFAYSQFDGFPEQDLERALFLLL